MEKEYAQFLLKKVQEDYNRIAANFARSREKPWEEGLFLVKDYVKEGDKVLDLGCGAGQWFEFFKQKNVEYFGVDFSEKLIEIAKSKYPEVNFKVANVFNLPFGENFFDKVYAIALFHHIPSKELRNLALKEIKRVLKKEGLLILTVWNLRRKFKIKKTLLKFAILKILRKSKLDFGDIFMNWKGIENCYFHCFRKRELKNLVLENSFNIIKFGEFFVGQKKKNSNFYLVAKK